MTDTWTQTGSLSAASDQSTTVKLLDGRVLHVGLNNPVRATCEIYDPSTSVWLPTGPLPDAKNLASVVVLPSGNVLAFGGSSDGGNTPLATSALFDPTAIYAGPPTPSARWAIEEGSGNTLADSVGGNTFTLTGETWSSDVPTPISGFSTQSISLNGSQYGTISSTSFADDPSNFSVSIWFKTSTNTGTLISKLQNEGNHPGWILRISGHTPYFVIQEDNSANYAGILSSTHVDDGAWHNLIVTKDSSFNLTMYIDGIVQSGYFNAGTITTFSNSYPLTLGSEGDFSNKFTGSIDDIRMYSSALTQLDATSIATTGIPSSVTIYGKWTPTNPLNDARFSAPSFLLASGKVLTAGGATAMLAGISSSEIFDPGIGNWTPAGSLSVAHAYCPYAMSGSTPVVIGGMNGAGNAVILTTETYNEGTDTWTAKTNCSVPGTFNDGVNNAVVFSDGSIMFVAGRTVVWGIGDTTGNCAIYHVGTDIWETVGSLNTARDEHQVWLLANDVVMTTAGLANFDAIFLTSTEVYNPISKTWSYSVDRPLASVATETQLGVTLNSGEALSITGLYGLPVPSHLSPTSYLFALGGTSSKVKASTFLVF